MCEWRGNYYISNNLLQVSCLNIFSLKFLSFNFDRFTLQRYDMDLSILDKTASTTNNLLYNSSKNILALSGNQSNVWFW